MVKSIRVIWQQQAESRGEDKMHAGIWWGNLKGKDYLEDTGTDGRIIFQW
jgi:hypothetical protein